MANYQHYTEEEEILFVATEHPIYGSSRIGVENRIDTLYKDGNYNPAWYNNDKCVRNLGLKSIELSNHLGNVLVTISDKKVYTLVSTNIVFEPEITTITDYYPFGSAMNTRSYNAFTKYRYGFNTQEKDDEVSGDNNSYTAEFWQYDGRLGRRFNVDPRPNPSLSNYVCFNNNPILSTDINGDSSVCDKNGAMIYKDQTIYNKDKKSRDLRIYEKQDDGTLKFIGNFGEKLKTNDMIENILSFNRKVAIGLNIANSISSTPATNVLKRTISWALLVLPESLWDYKNRRSLIFGVAWKYDEYHKKTEKNKTGFQSNYGTFADASDFGNFNAGYTGVYAGVPRFNQYTLAGLGEAAKAPNKILEKLREIITTTPPMGDQEDDYKTNTKGMNQADKEIDKMPWYQRIIIRPLIN